LGSAAIDEAATNVNETIVARNLVTKRTLIVASLMVRKNNSSHASAALVIPPEGERAPY